MFATLAHTSQLTGMKLVGVRMPVAGAASDGPQGNAPDEAAVVDRLKSFVASNGDTRSRLPLTVVQDEDGEQFVLTPDGRLTPAADAGLDQTHDAPEPTQEMVADAAGIAEMQRLTAEANAAALKMMSRRGGKQEPDFFETIAKKAGEKALATAAGELLSGSTGPQDLVDAFVAAGNGSGIDFGGLAASAAGTAIDEGLGFAANKATAAIMKELFPVDDESSAAEHAANYAAKEALGHVSGYATAQAGKWLKGMLGLLPDAPAPPPALDFASFPTSTANIAVGHIGFPDTAAGVATTGLPTVLVNGIASVRQGDTATMTLPIPDAGPVQTGNPTVLAGGQPLSGEHHIATGVLGTVATLQKPGPVNVFMGPQGVPVAVTTRAGGTAAAGAGLGGGRASGPATKDERSQPAPPGDAEPAGEEERPSEPESRETEPPGTEPNEADPRETRPGETEPGGGRPGESEPREKPDGSARPDEGNRETTEPVPGTRQLKKYVTGDQLGVTLGGGVGVGATNRKVFVVDPATGLVHRYRQSGAAAAGGSTPGILIAYTEPFSLSTLTTLGPPSATQTVTGHFDPRSLEGAGEAMFATGGLGIGGTSGIDGKGEDSGLPSIGLIAGAVGGVAKTRTTYEGTFDFLKSAGYSTINPFDDY